MESIDVRIARHFESREHMRLEEYPLVSCAVCHYTLTAEDVLRQLLGNNHVHCTQCGHKLIKEES